MALNTAWNTASPVRAGTTDSPAAADLVLDMLTGHPAHELPVTALRRAAEICGVTESSLRVSLTRLVRKRKIRNTARGVYALNSDGSRLFRDVENWIRKEQGAVPWQGDWIGVIDDTVPRRHKGIWSRHERALALRGFRSLNGHFHVRPNNLHGGVAALREDLHALGLADSALVLGVTELGETGRQRAMQLWDGRHLEDEYQRLRQRLEHSLGDLDALPLARAARESLLLGHTAIRSIIHDPLLPGEMVDIARRRALIDTVRRYQAVARQLWMRVLEVPGP